ncbi:MAG: S8 family serine peptidase [Chloroflexota bacterium]|nr:S8 family serine peptidase [Chloroflexota bacterium]
MNPKRAEALLRNPHVASVDLEYDLQIEDEIGDTEIVSLPEAQTLPSGVDRVEADKSPIAKIDGIDERVNVQVAVLDTGVDATHPDLYVNVPASANCTVDPCQTGVSTDGHSHGTHVAGTIAALDNVTGVVGVAPGAEIWSVQICSASGSCSMSAILAGLDYVAANSATVDVVNMSIGGVGWSAAYRQAVATLHNRGMVVAVAAGNSSREIYGGDGAIGQGNEYQPAAFPEAMTISAMADTDGKPGGVGTSTSYGLDDTLATFSNYSAAVVAGNPVTSPGAAIDVAEPGVSILSTIPGGQYGRKSGTSMASPHGAGLAALYIAGHGRPTDAAGAAAVRQAIINGAEPMADWRPDDADIASDRDANHEGMGRAEIGTAPPPPPPPPPVTKPIMRVTDIDATAARWARSSSWSALFYVTVTTLDDKPVAGALVTMQVRYGWTTKTISGTTSSSGRAVLWLQRIPASAKSVTGSVIGVSHDSYVYDPAQNRDPDGSSNGTTITVRRP